ncbi:MAG: site-2 protease family protein [Acutalibacteraceae bacterium]|nr:site-2 protease family protein [Acutalibacteraceae bacterium]
MITISLLEIWNNFWPYAVAVLAFILLIIIHEFGHFIAAKICGVRVNEFAVGFGPKLLRKKLGETEYAINLIPLGGYCAMEGEDENSQDQRAFCNKGPLKRLFIVANGAIFNLILGLIIIAITLIPGEKFASKTVAQFTETAVSSQHGLQVGDEILAVDGRKIFTTYDMSYAFTGVDDGKVDLTVKRDGEKTLLKNVAFETEEMDGISYVKVDFYVKGVEKTPLSFISHTVNTAIANCRVVWFSLIDLITGKYGLSAMSGPVGITAAIGSVAKANLFNILPIMALITINLGIFNLLPLPALDGGRILFILVELVARKPVPQKYEGWIHTAGLILLLGFMLIITAKDIITLIFG